MPHDLDDWDEQTLDTQGLSSQQYGHLAPGTVLAARYQVKSWLGSGGMGVVYEVEDLELAESVALKLLRPSLSTQPDHRARLRSEVRLARRVSHPNVCRVHDIGQHARQLFVTMEFLRGPTLRSLLDRNPEIVNAPLPRKIDTIVQICAGLSAAHKAGVLHRDVKPDNVIVERDRVVLTDFGVASLANLARDQIAGTPAYMAPEVLLRRPKDQRVDVYSVGVLAFELLVGKRPFLTPDVAAVAARARSRPMLAALPERVASPHIRALLDQVFSRALAIEPQQRWSTVDALAVAIARAARGDRPGTRRSVRHQGEAAERPETQTRPSDTLLGWVREPVPMDTETDADRLEDAVHTTPRVSALMSTPDQRRRQDEVRVATALHVCGDSLTDGTATITVPIPAVPAVSHASVAVSPTPSTTAPTALPESLERAIVDLGGTPVSVAPGRFTAVFGAPVAYGDDAARAARAAFAVLGMVPGARAGIDTGKLLYRWTAAEGPTASGSPLQQAEHLAARADSGRVLASPACARHLVGRYATAPAPGTSSARERALVVSAPTEYTSGPPAAAELFGRRHELQLLESCLHEVCENRSPHFATVMGAAGIGKSHLRSALMAAVAERRDVHWLVAPATPLGEVASLSLLMHADPRWYAAAAHAGLRDRAAVYTAARRWLELRASRRPVALVVEDLHWVDDMSLGLLRQLRTSLHNVPVFILATARPALLQRVPDWAAGDQSAGQAVERGQHTLLELAPLAAEAAWALARHVAPSAGDQDLQPVVQRAEGNPFFVQELARELRERRRSGTVGDLPETVELVLQARLDRLPERERELCRAAAVVGTEFWRESARDALEESRALDDIELDEALAELERRDIVYPLPPSQVDDDCYAFHSGLIRDVAYRQLPPRERRRTHAAVARWLQRRASIARERNPTMLARIAQHRDLAGDRQGALRDYRLAGAMSLELYAYADAVRLLRRAQTLSSGPEPELWEQLADALVNAKSVEAAEELYRDALHQVSDDSAACARLYQKLGHCARLRGDSDEAVRWFQRGLQLVEQGRPVDERVVALLHGGLGWILGYRMNQQERALEHCERAVALLEGRPQYRRDLARALGSLGAIYMRLGRWRDQLRCNQRNLEIARALDDLTSQATAHCNLGVVHGSLGEFEQAIAHTRESLGLSMQTGNTLVAALLRSNLAGLFLEVGQHDAAQLELAEGIRLAEKTGSRNFLTESYTFAARLALHRGDAEQARRDARLAVELAARDHSSIDEGIACRILGAILARTGDPSGASASFAHAHELLRETDPYEDARTDAAEARFLLARDGAGDRARARELRERARQVFTRLGARGELQYLDDPDAVR